jgi:hypothetical protein
MVQGDGLDFLGTQWGSMAGSYKYDNETLCSIRGREFLELLCDVCFKKSCIEPVCNILGTTA